MDRSVSPTAADFSIALLAWFDAARRDLPWRRARTPWRTWVSEVMLQQTTVDTVAPRFEAFVERFPTPRALAEASDDAILSAWSGLGYYRRVRMLRDGARACVERHSGEIPTSYATLSELPGVGPYTAGAIASLAFDEAVPAVDGNVGRVVSRIAGLKVDPSKPAGRRAVEEEIRLLMPASSPGAFNEAMIELGALVCRPTRPRCDACPVRAFCVAVDDVPENYPLKKTRQESVAVSCVRAFVPAGDGGAWTVAIDEGGRLAGFREFPGRWLAPGESAESALRDALSVLGFSSITIGAEKARCRHTITRHRITAILHAVRAVGPPSSSPAKPSSIAELSGPGVTTETRKLVAAAAEVGP